MYSSSTQKKFWTFANESELERKRRKCNTEFIRRFADPNKTEAETQSYFLTCEEERRVVEFYELKLKEFCLSFVPKMPNNVTGTVFHYFKRFYLRKSVMDYHPNDISLTCAYLACKTEEFNVTMPQFTANVKGDEQEKVTEIILNNEMLLMEAIKFHLTIFNSYDLADAYCDHIQAHQIQLQFDTTTLKPYIEEFLQVILMTDAPLLFTPAQIALAGVLQAASKVKGMLDTYVTEILVNDKDKLQKLTSAVKGIRRFVSVRQRLEKTSPPVVNDLEEKLSVCRNQENNPYGLIYKNKMQMDLEDDDDGM